LFTLRPFCTRQHLAVERTLELTDRAWFRS
jgi:hypothetical protein